MKQKIFTLPNILSLARLLLIPIIIKLYTCGHPYYAAGVLVLSGLTDMLDGYIARHFNMISDLGKALDPVADKLTQLSVLFCLILDFPAMGIPFGLLFIKELVSGISALLVIKKTKKVEGADWHGKVTTTLLYTVMVLHIIFPHIHSGISYMLIGASTGMMMLSFILYSIRHLNASK